VVLDCRPRAAIRLPHFFANLAVLALEPATDGGVVGTGETGEHRSISAVVSSQSGAPSGSVRTGTVSEHKSL
jgi:hypothetical protein